MRGQETGIARQARCARSGGHRFELCLHVDDVDAAVAALRAAGVPVLVEPADQPWGERMAYVRGSGGQSGDALRRALRSESSVRSSWLPSGSGAS